jgi:HK97 family phage major capsid protein
MFGTQIVKSAAWRHGAGESTLDVDAVAVKTLLTTSAGFAPESTRNGRVVEVASRPLQVTDVVPVVPTDSAVIKYMQETTFTPAAVETAEAGTYAEATFVAAEQTAPVRKIGTWIPVTDEVTDDDPAAAAYLDSRLNFAVRQRTDGQIAAGDGAGVNIRGLVNTAGIQTQARATDKHAEAIFKAIVKVYLTGRAIASAVLIHPTDWQTVCLDQTGANAKLNTALAIWDIPMVPCDSLTVGTALVGDFLNFTEFRVKRDVTVSMSNSHGTFFIEGKKAVRADVRGGLVVYRPAALCSVTGL